MGVSVVQALFSLYFSYMGCFYHIQRNGLLEWAQKTNKYTNMHACTLTLENNQLHTTVVGCGRMPGLKGIGSKISN